MFRVDVLQCTTSGRLRVCCWRAVQKRDWRPTERLLLTRAVQKRDRRPTERLLTRAVQKRGWRPTERLLTRAVQKRDRRPTERLLTRAVQKRGWRPTERLLTRAVQKRDCVFAGSCRTATVRESAPKALFSSQLETGRTLPICRSEQRISAMAGFQILLVEDHAMHSKLAGFLLEEAGHSVQIAENAERALDVLRWFRPDLILMDIDLPGQDGIELTRELRLNPVHMTTPIVALTAYTDPSDLARARQAGCDGHISKPIDTATFARQVRNCFRGASRADPDVRSDSGDVLAEIHNTFLAEGLQQCDAILNEFEKNPGCISALVHRVSHRWAGLGGTLGFPEISQQARRVEALLNAPSLEYIEVLKGIQTARRRFCAAASHEPQLPRALARSLLDVRIGLLHFSEEEANRIRSAAKRANVQVVIERISGQAIDSPIGYGALIVNECNLPAEAARPRPQWPVPVVFIGSRAMLESLSKLPSRAADFLIAPWEAEEVLMRVCRLLSNPAPSPPDPLHRQKRRPRVLIADDDPDLVALVGTALGQFGMDCDTARSGQQALDTVGRHAPDAIVLDVNMVDLDGFEVLKKLRHNLATKAIPVLLLTARNQESDITRGFECGADDYVVKPFHPSELAKRLDKIISTATRASVFR